jgi:hypothetical protein
VYVGEFLIAVMAVLSLWSQVGGQGHLDLMPWYLKLGLTSALALVTVMGTAAALSHPDAWNAKTIAFVILGLLLACAMGVTSYYYHIHENDDEKDDTTPAVARRGGAGFSLPGTLRVGLQSPRRCTVLQIRRLMPSPQAVRNGSVNRKARPTL